MSFQLKLLQTHRSRRKIKKLQIKFDELSDFHEFNMACVLQKERLANSNKPADSDVFVYFQRMVEQQLYSIVPLQAGLLEISHKLPRVSLPEIGLLKQAMEQIKQYHTILLNQEITLRENNFAGFAALVGEERKLLKEMPPLEKSIEKLIASLEGFLRFAKRQAIIEGKEQKAFVARLLLLVAFSILGAFRPGENYRENLKARVVGFLFLSLATVEFFIIGPTFEVIILALAGFAFHKRDYSAFEYFDKSKLDKKK